ncbi:hypothetical protein [Pseudomonas sp. NPDC090208]|uniref:hypothetical protein n=1 Tax=Pseudomonas sp. NPDC090208 TaxID=3364478 RepID=UPI003813F123
MRIWLDTEFNGFGGELISIGMVDEHERPFYAVLECTAPTPWVAENVIPKLAFDSIDRPALQMAMRRYLCQFNEIEVIADWPEDLAHFCALLITAPGECMALPPLTMTLCTYAPEPSEYPHNALHDARALRKAAMRGLL